MAVRGASLLAKLHSSSVGFNIGQLKSMTKVMSSHMTHIGLCGNRFSLMQKALSPFF